MNEPPNEPLQFEPNEQFELRQLANNFVEFVDDEQADYQDYVEEIGVSSKDVSDNVVQDGDMPDILKEHATCAICLDIIVKPVTLICQHSFCYECLVRLIKKEKNINNQLMMHNHDAGFKYKCPNCKFPFIFPKKQSYNYMLEAIINAMIPESMKFTRKVAIAKRDFEDTVKEELREELMEIMLERNAKKTIPDLNYKKPQRNNTYCYQPPRFPLHHEEPEKADYTMAYAAGTGLVITGVCVSVALLFRTLQD